jgi:diguanylate cyclase (GGDEF)-like protein
MRAKAEASLQKAREDLHQMAHSDMLTGLPNRPAFYNQLPLSLAQAEEAEHRLAVLFIDLDDFKPINDTYGHEVGDQLLQQAAQRLRQQLRSSDFIARFGGDEFVAILPGLTEQHEVGRIADKLINALSSPFSIAEHQCSIGVSVGIGLYPDCASNADGLVQLADHAMYTAKLSGKNGYAVCPVLQGQDVTPYQGKCTCNRSCLQGMQCGTHF